VIPSRFILPDGERKGIVINLAEMRLYYYPKEGGKVSTYPVGIGQEGWHTPLGKTQVVRKREHPTWVVPDSIMENHIAHGQPIPKVQPPGPTNPLGDHALNLGFGNIVIHGTPYPKGVGVRSSHGCIRMLPEDVAVLYQQVPVGTPVEIINISTKIGHEDKKLFLESHVPIENDYSKEEGKVGNMIHKVASKNSSSKYSIKWAEVTRAQTKAQGYPIPIGSLF
jgi:L,D-transpeptidase ErfK/SrfK